MIRYSTFPRTEPPAEWVERVVGLFRLHEAAIDTEALEKGLTSDEVLALMASDFETLGFQVERGKQASQKIERPVLFGENGAPTVKYQVDGYHPEWRCGLEIEAGRAWMGNAVYRDLVQALVMVEVEWLCLAVSNTYKFMSSGRQSVSRDYDNARDLAEAVYGHSRVKMPYRLLLVGY
jgi:hypothetical protein